MEAYQQLQKEKQESANEKGFGEVAFRRPSSKQRFRIATPGGGGGSGGGGGGGGGSSSSSATDGIGSGMVKKTPKRRGLGM